MSVDNQINHTEQSRKEYIEDLYDRLPNKETGVEIPTVTYDRLQNGKLTRVTISPEEQLGQEGWSINMLKRASVGDILPNISGEKFLVLCVKKNVITVRDIENDFENNIRAMGRKVKAHEYRYRLNNNNGEKHVIKVYDTIKMDNSLDTVDFLDDIIKNIPACCFDLFDSIVIHPEDYNQSGGFKSESSLFTPKKVLNLYISEDFSPQRIKEILYHEIGHAISKAIRGSSHPGPKWKSAMDFDGNQMSEYAHETRYEHLGDQGEVEDIAEAVRIYLATDGAKSGVVQQIRDRCPARFRKLDAIFNELSSNRRRTFLRFLNKKIENL